MLHLIRTVYWKQMSEGNCASMYSVHDRVIVDNMYEFQHSSSRAGCTFSMQDSRVKRRSNIGHKTQQARLPAESGLYNPTCPSLVNCILTIPECRSDHHGSCTCTAWSRQRSALSIILARHWAFKSSSPISLWRQSVHKISYCLLLLLCSCFAHCCHDPFIVRSASNLSTVPWFHPICAPSRCSRSPTTVCFCFCFCSCSCFCCWVGVWVPRGCLCANVKASSPAQIEATRWSYQVFVRTCQVCISAKVCTQRVCRLYARSIIGLSPSSCNGTNLANWTIS